MLSLARNLTSMLFPGFRQLHLMSAITASLSSTSGAVPTATCSATELDYLSCSANSTTINTCCTESPGGLLLQTQFWLTNTSLPSLGPKDSWTIHGLWGDFCNGSYPADCDASRAYSGDDILRWLCKGDGLTIEECLEATEGQGAIWYEYLSNNWVNDPVLSGAKGGNKELWAHEWGKHGTCMSTLEPGCYAGYNTGDEAVSYMQTTTSLFESLPTYSWLQECGIVPSNTITYAVDDVISCVRGGSGATPHVGCSGSLLTEVWYYFHLRGPVKDAWMGVDDMERWVPTDTTYGTNCEEYVWYHHKYES